MSRDFASIPDPVPLRGHATFVRLVQALGFRFHWASKDLAETHAAFAPAEGMMSIAELQRHLRALAVYVAKTLGATVPELSGTSLVDMRRDTLAALALAEQQVLELGDDGLAAIENLAYQVNGPLADALTHVGQLNSWRRLAGSPTPKANLFKGQPA